MKVIDLFAGCGGMTAGFVSAGYDPILSVEWDLQAAATYAANFGAGHTYCGDIAALRSIDVPRADVVIGGPPCQGFSNLGNRSITDPRNKLWQEYLRLVVRARPKIFVIENVDRFLTSSEFEALQGSVADGALRGYSLSYGVLNAADFGVAQRRNRTIVIGSRVGPVHLPEPTHSRGGVGGLTPWRTVRDALEGVPAATRDHVLPERVWRFDGADVPGTFTGADLHLGRRPTAKSLQRYDCVPPGGWPIRPARRAAPQLLAQQAHRHHRRHGPHALGRPVADHPYRVLQAREGPVPAPAVG